MCWDIVRFGRCVLPKNSPVGKPYWKMIFHVLWETMRAWSLDKLLVDARALSSFSWPQTCAKENEHHILFGLDYGGDCAGNAELKLFITLCYVLVCFALYSKSRDFTTLVQEKMLIEYSSLFKKIDQASA